MEDKRILSSGEAVFFAGDPETAGALAAAGSCFFTLPGVSDKADGYVTCAEDFEELKDTYLERVICRHLNKPAVISRFEGLVLRECEREDFLFLRELLKKNTEAVERSGILKIYEDGTAFEKALREKYAFFDFGPWILEKEGERVGLFGLSAGEEGIELYYIAEETYRRLGISKKTCREIIKYAKDELCAERLFIRCKDNNMPSRRLAEGLGFMLYSSERKGAVTELKFVKQL